MRSRRDQRHPVDIWPGFVDALSTLLLAVIFMLVVFVLGQFFLGQLLQGRDQTVARLEEATRTLRAQLEIEQGTSADLRRSLAQLGADLQNTTADRDELSSRLARREQDLLELQGQIARQEDERVAAAQALEDARRAQTDAERQSQGLQQELTAAQGIITADRAKLEEQAQELVRLNQDIATLEQVRAELEKNVAALTAAGETTAAERDRLLAELGSARDRSKVLEAELASSAEKTMLAQREIEELGTRVAALAEARDSQAEARAQARAQAERLAQQVAALSAHLTTLNDALEARRSEIDRQNTTIADLGQRLNIALASKVEELSRFRSDFFGKLRQVLGEREDVRIVGDRFVFQSEVLFGSGEADIGAEGREQLAKLATAFKEIMAEIPDDLPWVLQVDGHTDKRPIRNVRFPSNWELSTARAISVARFLISQGIPAERVAARGFAEFAPLDPADTEEAYRRNRRIELKLTTR